MTAALRADGEATGGGPGPGSFPLIPSHPLPLWGPLNLAQAGVGIWAEKGRRKDGGGNAVRPILLRNGFPGLYLPWISAHGSYQVQLPSLGLS